MIRALEHRVPLFYAVMIALLLAVLVGPQQALAARTCTIRYYLSPMVGSGTADDPLRPLAIDLPSYPHHTYATAWNYLYGYRPYALVVIASTNHKPLVNNEELGAFPDVPLDTAYWDMTSEQVAAFTEAFDKFGIEPQEMMEESTTYRHSLEYIARWITSYDLTIPTLDSCPLKQQARSTNK
jgi:hypothetical protein